MTSKEKIKEILKWVQDESCIDWNFMRGLQQDLNELAKIAYNEGIDKLVDKVIDNLDKK